MMRNRGMRAHHLGWPGLNGWTSASFLTQQPACWGFLTHPVVLISPAAIWIVNVRRGCGGWLPVFTAQEEVGPRGKMAFLRSHSWSLSKPGSEPSPVSLPVGPHLQPALGSELYIPPSSLASSLSLDLLMMLFLLSVNVLSSQVYSVIKN